jgi:hypothetical protein
MRSPISAMVTMPNDVARGPRAIVGPGEAWTNGTAFSARPPGDNTDAKGLAKPKIVESARKQASRVR